MNEADFYRSHVSPHLKQWGDHCRIENAAESGTPDISYAIAGIQGFIETKIVRNGHLSFEKFQLAWMKKRLRHAKGNLWIFASDGEALYVYSAEQMLRADRHKDRDWLVIYLEDIEQPLVYSEKMPWDWGKVLSLLTRHVLVYTATKD